MCPDQLRIGLTTYLGRVLTPEAAAHIEAMALLNMMPLPLAEGDITNEQGPEFFDFANEALHGSYKPSTSRVLSRVADGRIRGVVVFSDPRRWSLEMSIASDGSARWMTRTFLRTAFRYPFVQLKLLRVTGRVESDNHAALALDEHLGFVREGVQRAQFGDKDAILFGMLARECRWLDKEKQ